tara:strand:+ start:121 stop:1149 length:1029 start_codon:yes stop_codon:yes gene_type:complete
MKLLLENWRKYLAERKTDQVYADLVDFFVDLYTTPSNFEWKDEEEEKEYGEWIDPDAWDDLLKGLKEEADELPEPPEPEHGMSHQYFLVEPRLREAWIKLKSIPGAPELLGMGSEDDLVEKVLESTTLEISYGLANFELIHGARYRVQEKPALDEKLLGMYADGILGINLAAKGFNMNVNEFINLNEGAILEYAGDKKEKVRAVIEHEFTHMLNHFRAGTLKRDKGIGRQHRQKDPETQGNIRYANSTEEIQARLIPIFKFVANTIQTDARELDDDPSSQTASLIRYEIENFAGNESLANIVKLLFKLYELQHPRWIKLLNSKNRQRITQRFYEFAQELSSK